MPTPTEALREEIVTLRGRSREILAAAESEKRGLTATERDEDDKLYQRVEEIEDTIRRLDRDRELARRIAEDEVRARDAQRGRAPSGERPASEATRAATGGGTRPRATEEYRAGFQNFLRGGIKGISEAEHRALTVGSDADGGFLVADEVFARGLIEAVDDELFVRRYATVETLTEAKSLGVPSRDSDLDDFDWTAEIQTVSTGTDPTFGKRSLTPHFLTKEVDVSRELVRLTTRERGIEAIVQRRLAYKFGGTQETAFMTGSGANQPLGVFTASAQGISTARDVATGNTTTSITFDGIKEAYWTLKPQYRARARWLYHNDAGKQIDKIKDGDGNYIWSQSVRDGEPNRLNGIPVDFSYFAPNTFTTGQYVGLLCDWSQYWIVDGLDIQVQVLTELLARTNQLGYIARGKIDGMPVLEEAFVRVTLA